MGEAKTEPAPESPPWWVGAWAASICCSCCVVPAAALAVALIAGTAALVKYLFS